MSRVIGLLVLVLFFASCSDDVYIENALVHSIPTDSKIIIALSDLQDVDDLIQNNPVFNQLQSLSRVQELKKASTFLENYDLKDDSFIALSIEGKNQVAITLVTDDFKSTADSISVKKTISYNEVDIIERSVPNGSYFTADKNGVHMASSSLLVLESLIRRDIEGYVFDSSFEKLFDRTHNDLNFYVKATDDQWLYQFLLGKNKSDQGNYAQWYQLEMKADAKSLHMEGLLIYKDSIKQKHALYNNLDARENQIDKIAPANSRSLSSVTYTDADDLIANLNTFYNRKPAIPKNIKELLANSQEISEIQLESGAALAFTLQSYETLFIDLDSLSSAKTTYRDHLIYSLTDPILTASLKPLILDGSFKQLAILDNFLVLAAEPGIVEEIISNYENGTTLSAQFWWKEARKNMSNSSTLLIVTSLQALKSPLVSLSKEDQKVLDQLDGTATKAIISQYVHEDKYAFYRMEIPFTAGEAEQPLVAQVGTYKPEKNIIAGPFLFPNHLNDTQDVAFQTDDLKLTLISENGTPYWSKELDSKIQGQVNAVDAYKNGRKQLLFSTSKNVYLLDRDGNDVDAFPYKSSSPITQALSVFDYTNDLNYRIVVTTGDDLQMLDARGEKVSGFNYKKSGAITSSPQHFRKGTKDYIAFTTSKNQLKLLSRTGEVRTNINENIDARSPLYFNNNLVQLVTSDNKLLHINPTTGKVVTTKTSLNADSHIYMTDRSQLIQNKNVIQFNGNKISLPYGSYLPATITKVGNKDFATIVDDGENKVYILDNQGKTIPFLPVYGNGRADISGSKDRYLTTRDGNDVIIYKW
ncbi:hypothetical protein [Nonlabens antarcticus]|uniref:hypothetical protein n=1 Tax=Nonlabens antarcticus TaxID=392714 RepID=UPI001891C0E9|nr:hypothetical protein [Nonlabens antarcticus]